MEDGDAEMTVENLVRLKQALRQCSDQWATAAYLGHAAKLFEGQVHWLLCPLVKAGTVEKQRWPKGKSTVRYRVRGKLD